ncbi:hypothetical protein VPH35_003125 [Triticum aestivum]
MHLPLFVYCSLSRLEVIPNVLNASSTSSYEKEAKKKTYLLRDVGKFLEHNRLIGASATIHSTIVQLQKEHKFKKINICRRARGEGRVCGWMMAKFPSSCLDVQDTLLLFYLCSG